jgi:hypothetical protein
MSNNSEKRWGGGFMLQMRSVLYEFMFGRYDKDIRAHQDSYV